jgi:hypothetical protein
MKLIKTPLICLFISSCSTIDIEPYRNIYNSLQQDKSDYRAKINKVTSVFEDSQGKSFLTRLDSISEGNILWKIDSRLFITKNGRIIQTSGFKNDFKLIKYNGIQDSGEISGFIMFSNPQTSLLDVNFTYNVVKEINSKNKYKIIQETVSIPDIRYLKNNFYWFDSNGDIVKSKQYLVPFAGKSRIYYM